VLTTLSVVVLWGGGFLGPVAAQPGEDFQKLCFRAMEAAGVEKKYQTVVEVHGVGMYGFGWKDEVGLPTAWPVHCIRTPEEFQK
jgi:hypothetical protein